MRLGQIRTAGFGALVVAVASVVAAPPALAAPVNDNLADAAHVAVSSTNGVTNTDATLEVGEPQPSCVAGGDVAGHTVWYRVRSRDAATLILSTFGSKIDTTLAVYQGGAKHHRLSPVACNDDVEELGSLQSRLRFPAEAGRYYLVQIGSLNGQAGRIKFTSSVDPRPLNDDVADATLIREVPFSTTGDLTHATAPSTERVCGYSSVASVWYRYRPTEASVLRVTASAAGYGQIEISRAGESTGLACGYLYGQESTVSVVAEPGEYLIQMAAAGYDTPGPFRLALDAVPLPANDNFDSPTELTSGVRVTQTVAGATVEPGEEACGWVDGTVWFSFTPETTDNFSISTAGSDFVPSVAVYTVAPGGLTQIGCSDVYLSGRPMVFPGQAGRQYFIQVGRSEYEQSNLGLAVSGVAS